MEENQLKISPELVIGIIKRRSWCILLPLFFVLIGGIYFAKVTPRIYEAKTLILVEGQRVPQSYVRSIVTEETSDRINTISQQILSRTNLEKVVKMFSLFENPDNKLMYMEDKVALIRKNIDVNVITNRSTRQTEAFEISFKGKDPEKVMQIVNSLAASFIDENLRARESQALGTSDFLESELESGRLRLEEVEEEMKNFRKNHMGELPEQLETNLRILERLQENLSDRQQDNREAKIQLADLKSQATSRQPSVVIISGEQQRQQEGVVTIGELMAELETLESRYTEKHPDIIRLKKQIAEMEAKEASIGRDPKQSNIPSRISPELRRRIIELQQEIKSTDGDIRGIEEQIKTYQQRIENTPKREQELLSLKRDYQNIQSSYDSLLDRKLEADIAVNMERKQKGEQFRIVDPARIPKRPVEPDMMKVFLIVVVGGLGIGAGLAVLLEFKDSSYRKPDELERAMNIPVLVSIPLIEDSKQIFFRKLNAIGSISFAIINACLLGVFGMVSLTGLS